MRTTTIICVVGLMALLVGCSKSDKPVVVTPEMEAEQKQAEKDVRDAEAAMQKKQKVTGKLSGEEEEAAMQRKRR